MRQAIYGFMRKIGLVLKVIPEITFIINYVDGRETWFLLNVSREIDRNSSGIVGLLERTQVFKLNI